MTDPARDQIYIDHMLECLQRIDQYVGTDKDRFFRDTLLQDAVMRVLQVMAESSQRLSEGVKKTRPEIDWRGISGFRNILQDKHGTILSIRIQKKAGVGMPKRKVHRTRTSSDFKRFRGQPEASVYFPL